MANVLFEINRGRMMVDKGVVDDVYLPWIISILNGTLNPDSILKEKGAFEPKSVDLTKNMFSTGAYGVMDAMDMAKPGSVAVIPVIGEFLKRGTACSYGADEIVPAFYAAANNENIIAVVLEMDSGGGAEKAVPPFIDAIKYIQSKGKPVVLHGDMVASAAYYVGSFCDYLMADNLISSAWGSIGVYVSFLDYKEKFAKEGIKVRDIYAPQSSMKNLEYRALVNNDDEQPLIDNMLEPSADRFIKCVKDNRKGKIDENSDVYKGKLYEGKEIVKVGLADGFGNLSSAINVAVSLAKMKK